MPSPSSVPVDHSAEAALANADAAAEQIAAQQREHNRLVNERSSMAQNPGADIKPAAPTPDAAENLDKLFSEVSQTKPPTDLEIGRENAGVPPPIPGAREALEAKERADAEARAAEEKETAEKAAREAADRETAEKAAKEAAKSDKPKGLLDDLLSTEKAKADAPADPYGEVKLRADASPKTRETFENLKKIAQERESAALAKASDFEKQLGELRQQLDTVLKNPLPEDVKKELEELRGFRARLDVQHTPEFRAKFDGRISANYDAVYSRLQTHGLKPEVIEELKGMSQEQRDATIDGWLEKLPAQSRLYITAKLADNINLSEAREQELRRAQAEADKVLAAQRQAPVQQQEQRLQETIGVLRPVLDRVDWLHEKDIPATAGAEEKKTIEAWNTFAVEQQGRLRTALTDDSPRTRAEAALAVPLAAYFKREFEATKSKLAAVQGELDAIKKASSFSRAASRSVASPAGIAPAPAARVNEDSGDALDAQWKEIQGRAARAPSSR